MKSFLLAAMVAAGLACTASDADAQLLRGRRAASYYNSYSYPSYSSYGYPSYGYSTYSSPYSYSYPSSTHYSFPSSSYSYPYTSNGVITTSGYSSVNPIISTGGSYYYPGGYNYSGSPSYYNYPFTGSSYPSYYSPSGITPNGVYMGGQRIWHW